MTFIGYEVERTTELIEYLSLVKQRRSGVFQPSYKLRHQGGKDYLFVNLPGFVPWWIPFFGVVSMVMALVLANGPTGWVMVGAFITTFTVFLESVLMLHLLVKTGSRRMGYKGILRKMSSSESHAVLMRC